MKKILTLTILFSMLFSCEKIDQLTQFTFQNTYEFIVPADTPVNTDIQLSQIPVELDNSALEAHDTSKDLLEEVSLDKVSLEITNPTTANFDFLKDLALYIEADNLPKVRVAWKTNLQNGQGNTIELDILKDNLVPYFKGDNIKISISIKTDEPIVDDITVQTKVVYFVDAKVLGV